MTRYTGYFVLEAEGDAITADDTTREEKIWVRTWQRQNMLVVEIADYGLGSPPELESRIFGPFFTTMEVGAGTGLGLELACRIVMSRHQGDIRVFSQPDNTRFQVSLPFAAGSR